MAICLVTGASGYIGGFLVKHLIAANHKVIALVREKSLPLLRLVPHPLLYIAIYKNIDDCLKSLFSQYSIDAIFHLAAQGEYTSSYEEIESMISVNITFGSKILELMSQYGCRKLINVGSYFETAESAYYMPQNFYAATKFSFQKIIDFYTLNKEIKAITLRLTDTYGPNDYRNKLWPMLLSSLKNSESLLLSKGEQLIDLVHVYDVCNALICAWNLLESEQEPKHQIYYLSSKMKRSLKNIVELFENIANQKLNIEWGARLYRENEIMNPYIGEVLPNWQANIKLEDGFYSIIYPKMDSVKND